MKRLKLGDIEFNDGSTLVDGKPAGWFFRELKDWDGLTQIRESLSPRPVAHGSFSASSAWRTSAAPSFTAIYVAQTSAEAAEAVRDFVGSCGAVELPMQFTDDDGLTLGRTVRVTQVAPASRRGGDLKRVLTVYTEAADPLMYGLETVGSTGVPTPGVGVADPITDPFSEGAPGNLGRVAFTNTGTAPTSVTLMVAGGLSGGVEIRVVETGEILRLERLIPDGSVVTFRSRTGRAVIDGQSDVTGFLTVDDWPQVPAGATRTFQFTPLGVATGTPSMSVSASPAYF